ncbi:aspartic proteinase nepenthesin-2 [Phtheirospermum japonicum]|uniref:Aspartic proteinase nepenthesin-2 n=1 Tax=Phtheirospermum japonicum TaxID=374723 RepID=A0A830CJJ6_9LAMI|nr:aspartic proteinase nepenthesin-2 [Phtheirospermum japonicum]
MDTGSGLLWINCEPCGFNVPAPIFEPRESTTFRNETCYQTTFCFQTGPVNIQCDGNGPCAYEVQYPRQGNSKGYLARDSFKFASTYETLLNIGFGCARSTSIATNGVMGLNNNRVSIVSQLQSTKFGYCIGNISDKAYSHSMLVIGDDIKVMGRNTPIIVEDKYYLTLVGIKIGGKPVEFDATVFKRNSTQYTGGMLVDTGSTYTFIPRPVLYKVEDEIIDVMIGLSMRRNYNLNYYGYRMLCYDGVVTRDLTGFPFVEFVFEGEGATMVFSFENMFRQVDDKSFCSVLLPSALMKTSISILGNMMQQYYYIAYDLAIKQFSFQKMGCEHL